MTTMSLGLSRDDCPILIAALFIVIILVVGTTYTIAHFGSAPLLSPTYLLQQLQIGSFLGIVAAGMMIVILIGQIDLSVPWTLAAAAMMATSIGGPLEIPVGLGVGLLVGVVNGIGVAYLRVPSMIFTLGVNAVMRGLMVARRRQWSFGCLIRSPISSVRSIRGRRLRLTGEALLRVLTGVRQRLRLRWA